MAHNGNLIPNKKGRDVMVQSWYQGGISIIDWTNPQNIRSSPGSTAVRSTTTRLILAGFWSSYFYNGYIYGERDPARVRRVRLPRPAALRAPKYRYGTLNAQTQERVR